MSKHHSKKSFQEKSGSVSFQEDYQPAYEEIQRRAYQIHEQKGGSELENWLDAQRELKDEHQRV